MRNSRYRKDDIQQKRAIVQRGSLHEKEKLVHERGRSRTPRNPPSLEERYNRKRERERDVSGERYNRERERERDVSGERYNRERERERDVSGGYGREKRRKRNESREIRNQEEITELRSIVMELTDKIEELHRNRSRTRIPSASPDTSASIKKARNNLEPMNKDYKKVFRDDVVNILKSLDASLQLDYKNRWTDIEIYVVQNVIPAIKRALGERFHYTDTELKKVLQNYHRHQRDTYILSLNPQKQKANRQRTGINSRRKDKKERRQRGLKRMIDTKDQMLTDLEFSNLIKDLREIINDSNYHSDEVSETDEEEAQEEKNMKIRPSRNENTNHVLHVYDKKWRSQRLRILLRRADEVGEATQNLKIVRKRWYDDQMYIDNSKPPRNAPEWAISSSYQSE
ncbi:hypothetical protein GLOIN_2v1792113 [Rhizophagus irregularis DAOM 181602=DAOM 197198]|nr:hypothetical protein GLOIN_2v1792113 [Rhizophagus irregularis DAOM 181602=DAOM 197198]